MLTTAWPTIQATIPTAASRTNGSLVRMATPQGEDRDRGEESEDGQRAEESELLADHREDEVGVGLGQRRPTSPGCAPSPTPQKPPVPSAYWPWVSCQPKPSRGPPRGAATT